MDTNALIDGLLLFVAFIPLVALHEFAHAWTAVRCGDDTPRLQGRLTLNPIAHIDLLGTIILPLIVTVVGALGSNPMLFGWGRPVEVNLNNFGRRQRDDILVSGAGPFMNLLITIAVLAAIKIIAFTGITAHANPLLKIAELSLFLCFFNLLPVPPLDGGHIMRNLLGISDGAYRVMSQYSFMFLLLVMQTPGVARLVSLTTDTVLSWLALPFGWHLTYS
jgi:Zn-dependent protease